MSDYAFPAFPYHFSFEHAYPVRPLVLCWVSVVGCRLLLLVDVFGAGVMYDVAGVARSTSLCAELSAHANKDVLIFR